MSDVPTAPVSKEERKFYLSNTIILFIILALMMIFFSLTSKSFLTSYNLISMLSNLSFMGIIASALTIVMITGELDISIGGTIGLTSCIVAFLLDKGLDAWLVVLIGILVGLVVGITNGFLVTVVGVNSMIATLGTMAVTRGLGFTLTDGRSLLAFNPVIDFIGRGTIFKVPFPIILFVVINIIGVIVMNFSKWGRRVYSVGANPLASFLSGINVKKVKFVSFVFCGLSAALGGLILTSLTAVGMPQHGMGLELSIISAVVLGGTALGGGRGRILGTLAGILIISVLYNGLTMLNVLYYYVQIAQGAVLIAVVGAYEIRQRRRI